MTVYYYDYRGREVRRCSSNHLGGYDVTRTAYDLSDNIVDTWASQSTANGLQIDEHYHYTYDHANRLLTTTYTYNNESPIVLQSFSYDELGRVRKRAIHDATDSICFAYNIRNQLTQLRSTGYTQNYYYTTDCPQDGYHTMRACYNGNIAATTWTYGDQTNGYIYYYDTGNRLSSTYSILDGQFGDYFYTESYRYDKHSNITQLERWDSQDAMNSLHLSCHGNQLREVTDNGYTLAVYDSKRYHDTNDSGDDFAYDANGNIRYDKDRGIAAIRYNLLNLPDTIQFTNSNQIIHTYDAAGNRLRTSYYTRKVTTTVPLGNTLPVGTTAHYHITRDVLHHNVVYHANNAAGTNYGIKYVNNLEGHIRYLGQEEHYHFYYIKDHLGNIRETYAHVGSNHKDCIQRLQYYPSGLPWNMNLHISDHPYKYNGKEFVEMHGLDEYDSHARWYYPALARTTTMDPHCEEYYPISPYAWCGNNFVNVMDPTGRDTVYFDADGYFLNVVEAEGNDVGVMLRKDGEPNDLFFFGSGKDDVNSFIGDDHTMPLYSKVSFISPSEIRDMTTQSNIAKICSQTHYVKYLYALLESRGGNLDYANLGVLQNYIGEHGMPIVDYYGTYIAQNIFNFGNFLWGISMRDLNIPYSHAVFGAHLDALMHVDINTGKHKLDSADDQLSILLGYFYFVK